MVPTMRSRLLSIIGGAILSCSAVALPGCRSAPPGDTLHPKYNRFNIERIGTAVWCAAYVPGDLASVSPPKIQPGMKMTRADRWDLLLSPLVGKELRDCLEREGYEVVDLRSGVDFGEGIAWRDVLRRVIREHQDLDAVLGVAYCVSPYHVEIVGTSFQGLGTSTQYRSYPNGINLKGRLKLIYKDRKTTLWELGDHATYYYGSCNLPGVAGLPRQQLVEAVCRAFGSSFSESHGTVRGFPECLERD
jgi:hypothetical protein